MFANLKLGAFSALLLLATIANAQTLEAFRPTGATANLVVTGTAQMLALPTVTAENVSPDNRHSRQLILTNIGTQTVFVRLDGVTATVSNALPLLANSQVVITGANAPSASVIAATTGSTLYATVGAGQ